MSATRDREHIISSGLATGASSTPLASIEIISLAGLGIGPRFGVNAGHGWMKLVAVFERDEEAERLAMETARLAGDLIPDGTQAPQENELEIVFPAMIAEAGPQVEGSIARVDTVLWDKPYVVGEDALARNPRSIPAQARLQDEGFIPILVRGAFARLMKLARARINVLVAQEMMRLRGQPLRPYTLMLAEELEELTGTRFSPENTGHGWGSGQGAATASRKAPVQREPYPGADSTLERQVRERIEARERARGAMPDQLKGGPARTGLPAAWVKLAGYNSMLGKRIRAGAPGITAMKSIAEPLALFYALALDGDGNRVNPSLMKGRQGFVDLGYLSIDLGEVYDMRPEDESLDTWELGASGPVQQIRSHISAHFDRQFETYEVEIAIRMGKIKVGNRVRDLPLHWDQPLIKRGTVIKDRLVARWKSGLQFENILLGGGWAAEERIVAPIQQTFDNSLLVVRPQTAVARGYAYLAAYQTLQELSRHAHQPAEGAR